MKKEPAYVKCRRCAIDESMDVRLRRDHCSICNDTHQVIDPQTILCNLCGECLCPAGSIMDQTPLGLFNATVSGGYDSYHLLDSNQYIFNFCEKCLRQLFIQCKIKPDIRYANCNTEGGFTEETWEADQSMYEYKVWCDNGGHHQAYLDKLCNTKKDCPNKAVYTVFSYDHFTEDSSCEEHKDVWSRSFSTKLVPFITNVFRPFL